MEIINHECYVSLEVAKLLKKAGFDWECAKNYMGEIPILWTATTTGNLNDDSEVHKGWKSVPTLDVAQRWLREVKGIEVNALCVYIKHIKKYSYTAFIKEYEREIIDEGFDTYEEAQEAGIKKALEMILDK